MTRLVNFIFIVILSTGFVISCGDDFLSPDPLSDYTPQNVYIDEEGFETILVRLRQELQRENTGNRHYLSTEFIASDLAVATFQADFTRNTPSNSQFFPFLDMFEEVYELIKDANVLISRIDDIDMDQEVRNRMVAEALWHRSYWYYRLVHSYGDIPWVGKEIEGAKFDFQTHSRWAILDKIQEDLEWAESNLPVEPERLGDVTKGAASHLLSKVYLANMEYENAVVKTSEIINGPYALMTERFGIDADDPKRNVQWDLHRWENRNIPENTETIYTTVDRPDAPSDAWSSGVYMSRLFSPAWWKILDSEGTRGCNWDTAAGDTLGQGNADVRTNDFWHYEIWEDENYSWQETPDVRRADINWIEMGDQTAEIEVCREGSPELGEQFNLSLYGSLHDTTDTWYSFPHYKTFVLTPNSSSPRGGQADWYIFRLAETYLIRAEANFWLGNQGAAADDINTVRDRSNAPLITAADVTIDYIFDERARELYMEEPRHSEMVRASYIMAAENIDGYSLDNFSQDNWFYDRVMEVNHHYHEPKLQWYGNTADIEPHHVLWPIPQDVITANTLGRVNQNIGYDGAENNEPPIETINETNY
ncbi:MAG TPA: RagB/SusD family nutrient uptake outer membrane protein [Fodinibius sp.]|nr:RagB/SusD family nutrient uptake outer membrane protein [Fodinibius sp.]